MFMSLYPKQFSLVYYKQQEKNVHEKMYYIVQYFKLYSYWVENKKIRNRCMNISVFSIFKTKIILILLNF